MRDTKIPPQIVSQLARLGVVHIEPIQPGMSGACVYRGTDGSGRRWAVKQWPTDSRESRVDHIHHLMSRARENGCEWVPRLLPWPANHRNDSGSRGTRHTVAGRHWELMEWMPGEPADADGSLECVTAGAAAIARFHQSVLEFGSEIQSPPAIRSRLARLAELDSVMSELESCSGSPASAWTGFDPSLRSVVLSALQFAVCHWDAIGRELQTRMRRHFERPRRTQYVLRDVHRGHILFAGAAVSGLIDFDAVRIDTPLTDLARWAGDFVISQENGEIVWQAVLAGFRQVCPSLEGGDAENVGFLRDLHDATTWISLINWLDWLVLQKRHFGTQPERIAERLERLIQGASQGT